MFAKDKISQSMIDAVKGVVESNEIVETENVKIKTSTGTKVLGHRYGNSAAAHKDQTKHSVDDIKEPSKKEVEKDARLYRKTPSISKSYLRPATQEYFSKTGEPSKNEEINFGLKDKLVEALKGKQTKLDKNHNNKLDAQDFAILRGQKNEEVEELEEKHMTDADKAEQERIVKGMKKGFAGFRKRYGERAKSVMYATATKQAMKEDTVEEEVKKSDVPAFLRKARGDKPLTVADAKSGSKDSISSKENLAKARGVNEDIQLDEEDNLSSIAKKHGMEFNRTTYGAGMKHKTKGEISINRYGEWHHKGTNAQGDSTNKFSSLDKHLSSLKEGKQPETDNVPFEKPYNTTSDPVVTDKSGAKHTPMSRARDLARSAMKKIKTEMLGKAPGNNG